MHASPWGLGEPLLCSTCFVPPQEKQLQSLGLGWLQDESLCAQRLPQQILRFAATSGLEQTPLCWEGPGVALVLRKGLGPLVGT